MGPLPREAVANPQPAGEVAAVKVEFQGPEWVESVTSSLGADPTQNAAANGAVLAEPMTSEGPAYLEKKLFGAFGAGGEKEIEKHNYRLIDFVWFSRPLCRTQCHHGDSMTL